MNRLFTAAVVENRKLADNHYLITLDPLQPIPGAAPGTFFMVSVDTGLDPLLKRPFSLHRWLGGSFQLFYRVTGKGTRILSEKKPGNRLDVIGPLGNGFPRVAARRTLILAAGGMGIAPIYALAAALRRRKPLLFYGTRTKETAFFLDDFRSLGIEPVLSTDDGSLGRKGNIVAPVRRYLSREKSAGDRFTILACGPELMLKSLSSLAADHGIPGFIAMEQHMACGIGTCLGCVVQTRSGYRRVCKEGPVFPMEDIVWK